MELITPSSPLGLSSDEYLSQLKESIRYERQIERKSNKEKIKSSSISLLKRSDLGFADAAEPMSFRSGRVQIQLPSVDHQDGSVREELGLFEQQRVLLQFGHTQSKPGGQEDERVIDEEFTGAISNIRKNTIQVLIDEISINDKNKKVNEAVSNAEFVHVGEILNPTRFDREKKAVQSLDDEVADIICGVQDASFDFSSEVHVRSKRHDTELYDNEKQAEAISLALATQDISCIQGPPGTGKTRVIIEIIRRYIDAEKTVLALMPSSVID